MITVVYILFIQALSIKSPHKSAVLLFQNVQDAPRVSDQVEHDSSTQFLSHMNCRHAFN